MSELADKTETGSTLMIIGLALWVTALLVVFFLPAAVKGRSPRNFCLAPLDPGVGWRSINGSRAAPSWPGRVTERYCFASRTRHVERRVSGPTL
jgi:hypothetical protein